MVTNPQTGVGQTLTGIITEFAFANLLSSVISDSSILVVCMCSRVCVRKRGRQRDERVSVRLHQHPETVKTGQPATEWHVGERKDNNVYVTKQM